VALDCLDAARTRLMSMGWAEDMGLGKDEALVAALAVRLVGFGDLLLPDALTALEALTWEDVTECGDALLLTLKAAGGLEVMAGADERFLFKVLRARGLAQPFEGCRREVVDRVVAAVAGSGATLEALRQSNLFLHLTTHTNEEIGYLSARVSRWIVGERRSHGARQRRVDYGLLKPLYRHLQELRGKRLNTSEVRGLLDRLAVGWERNPQDLLKGSSLLQAVSTSNPAGQPRGTISAHTARNVLEDILRILGNRGPEDLGDLTVDDIAEANAGRRGGWGRTRDAWSAIQGAARLLDISLPKIRLPLDEVVFSGRHVPPLSRRADAVARLPVEQQPLAAFLLTILSAVRHSEAERLSPKDVRVILGDQDKTGPPRILIQIGIQKGGRPGRRKVMVEPWAAELAKLWPPLFGMLDPDQPLIEAWPGGGDPLRSRGPLRAAFAALDEVWFPHLSRTMGAVAMTQAGVDRAVIGQYLGHRALASAANYVVLDQMSIGARARQGRESPRSCLTTRAIAYCLGLSASQAARLHAETSGDTIALTARVKRIRR
jgi:integrase